MVSASSSIWTLRDIKLALEELREDSAPGKLSSASQAGGRAPAARGFVSRPYRAMPFCWRW